MKEALRAQKLGLSVREGVKLAPYTTFKLGGPVDLYFEPENLFELPKIFHFLEEEGLFYFFLGGGSNLLVRDGGVRGAAVSLRRFRRIMLEGEELWAEAGAPIARLVALCAEEGLSGLEFLAGVPATLGGAVAMNAGAFGQEIKDLLKEVTLFWRGDFFTWPKEKLSWNYRKLKLPCGALIVAAKLSLKREDPQKVRKKIAAYLGKRRRSQPLTFPSAGCVFKNPPEAPAGLLIEASGLKGFRWGGAEVSRKHANFIINRAQASASDVLFLIDYIKERVFREFGLTLEEEVKIVGEA